MFCKSRHWLFACEYLLFIQEFWLTSNYIDIVLHLFHMHFFCIKACLLLVAWWCSPTAWCTWWRCPAAASCWACPFPWAKYKYGHRIRMLTSESLLDELVEHLSIFHKPLSAPVFSPGNRGWHYMSCNSDWNYMSGNRSYNYLSGNIPMWRKCVKL